MGPEVYLKALAMARNVAHQQGKQIRALVHRTPIEGEGVQTISGSVTDPVTSVVRK